MSAVVLATVVALLLVLVSERLKPDVAVMLAVSALVLVGALEPHEVLAVFSNPAPIAIAGLFVLAAGLQRSGALVWLWRWLAASAARGERRLLAAVLALPLAASAFLNNTPIVMIATPMVIAAARRAGHSASRYLIPLSYATILGGMLTLIGTSTNLIVDGIAQAHGLAPFALFEITAAAACVVVPALAFLYAFAPRVLPERTTLAEQADMLPDWSQRDEVVRIEALVTASSRYCARPLADLDLTARYGIRLATVERRGKEFASPSAEFQLEAGDVILVEGPGREIARFCANGDLLTIGEPTPAARPCRALVTLAIFAAVIVVSAAGWLPIAVAALIGAAALIASGALEREAAYRAVDWPLLVMIFGMLTISTAVQRSGLASEAAALLNAFCVTVGPWGMLLGMMLLTSLLTEVLSNNGVAALMTPVAIGLAQQLSVDARPFVVGVMFAASFSFATPIGYQTNTMVFTAGNYRFSDFLRLGLPLNLLATLVAAAVIPRFWPF